ncbi:hypothetical protein CDD83_2039 [Cordyceps sp. RAO-2017]|nr:hypothetical protein CDD83_2039 [Cordyceps sp. RAO-2017]
MTKGQEPKKKKIPPQGRIAIVFAALWPPVVEAGQDHPWRALGPFRQLRGAGTVCNPARFQNGPVFGRTHMDVPAGGGARAAPGTRYTRAPGRVQAVGGPGASAAPAPRCGTSLPCQSRAGPGASPHVQAQGAMYPARRPHVQVPLRPRDGIPPPPEAGPVVRQTGRSRRQRIHQARERDCAPVPEALARGRGMCAIGDDGTGSKGLDGLCLAG